MHTPVLLNQVIEAMEIKKDGLYVDATLGEGGYTKAIIEKGGKVLAIDLDTEQIDRYNIETLERSNGVKLVQGNFREIEKIAKENNFFPVDGVVFDLGLSMRQISQSGRGFSFKKLFEPLDMRMNSNNEMTAEYLLNHLSESELFDVFAKNSEEINSQKIAREVVIRRQLRRLEKVGDLTGCIDRAIGEIDNNAYKRIFQALRIEVNDEFENLKNGLEGAMKIIKEDGKVAVVTFHSIEDRMVKNFSRGMGIKLLNKKVIMNRRGRSFEKSAKLRVLIREVDQRSLSR
ncbi:16S rRNA (cytosine(1402)-N(4))-methyltransferase [Candidatus Roizmanbacteria bacterium CG_4_8_14_3_um_filter_34_9]|uniref:Ribosomal RNA small subunit methyltransferase H n=3 Tax=Candidatus Roizmaniibacteriota TaxID=1752723 RepID=A0A2M7AUN6_9BACT|nr:MAG: 16S rRNA (cytosine(1402)-N(4))-methyltransferase [Candidatus Roizmanbacteria bacterium CG07_land_8_20_14_0_80_34_15]PIU74316.1 MAG: 16S rRNA (cytosine(1402)-N(4))-methyltransferase [Candidatus Roizmanbacteria bacterium CG06_land_8_20_14_3_00_34_14]PIW73353.1 MAG: 16S rRNA (cytosine(1402)-N(4))-methyltransferase [Candidatus Roizmanbacteria bacterium CG_4_8_14_3_um_filter_34_9]